MRNILYLHVLFSTFFYFLISATSPGTETVNVLVGSRPYTVHVRPGSFGEVEVSGARDSALITYSDSFVKCFLYGGQTGRLPRDVRQTYISPVFGEQTPIQLDSTKRFKSLYCFFPELESTTQATIFLEFINRNKISSFPMQIGVSGPGVPKQYYDIPLFKATLLDVPASDVQCELFAAKSPGTTYTVSLNEPLVAPRGDFRLDDIVCRRTDPA